MNILSSEARASNTESMATAETQEQVAVIIGRAIELPHGPKTESSLGSLHVPATALKSPRISSR